MRHRILLTAAFLYLAIANVIWVARDTRPPFWDMAGHGSEAIHVYNAFRSSGVHAIALIPLQHLTGYYPPLYHTIIAGVWAVFGKSVHVAELGNLIAVAILLVSTYGIGRFLVRPFTAAIAAVLVSFFPLMLWLSREMIIDYWLTSITALAVWVLLKTDGFSDVRWSIGFGIVAGLGMLTKWTFPFFLILPSLWFARRNWKNAVVAAAIAALWTAYWYIPAIPSLRQFFNLNTAGGVFENDPNRLSLGAVVFYVRALEGYQLFFPLFIAFVAGLVILSRRFDQRWVPIVLWIVGGWLGLLLFQNKDPRYSAPLLPAVALIAALVFEKRRALTITLLVFLAFQHYVVSFGVRSLPDSVVLMKGAEGQLSWHWNLYTQSYFGLWGRPRREDWKIEHALQRVGGTSSDTAVRLGLVPDIPRFDSQAFQFYIDLLHLPIRLNRVGILDEAAIAGNDYILLAEHDLEHEASFAPDPRISGYIVGHPEMFRLADSFPLPNGDAIQLYKVGIQ